MIVCFLILYAGHCLDDVVDKQFILLMLGVLSQTDEAKQSLRARNPVEGREAYIRPGTSGRLCADFDV